jgi:transcriptional regulator with XRE-family HTH domain
MSRRIDVPAAEFAACRAALKLSQVEFAQRLGMARRTVIRGEQRGIELPYSWRSEVANTPGRDGLRRRWEAALAEAKRGGARFAKILAEVSQRLEAAAADAARRFAQANGLADEVEINAGNGAGRRPRAKTRVVSPRRGSPASRGKVTVSRSSKCHTHSKRGR